MTLAGLNNGLGRSSPPSFSQWEEPHPSSADRWTGGFSKYSLPHSLASWGHSNIHRPEVSSYWHPQTTPVMGWPPESRLNGAKQPGVPSLTRLLSHASSIQRQSDGKKALRWNAHCKAGPATPGLARLHRMRWRSEGCGCFSYWPPCFLFPQQSWVSYNLTQISIRQVNGTVLQDCPPRFRCQSQLCLLGLDLYRKCLKE